MSDKPKKSFSEMRREFLAQKGTPLPEPEPTRTLRSVPPPVDEDLIPDVLGDRTEDDLAMDSIIEAIDMLDAYRRWIGKEVDEKTTSLTEGVMVSCPNTGHRDQRPSAWINTDKKTWYCGGCQEGGDLYDMAAIHFGYQRPDYKEGKNFHDLRRDMAASYGYQTATVAGEEVIWREEKPAQPPVPQRPSNQIPPVAKAQGEPDTEDRKGLPQGAGEEAPPAEASVTTLREEDVEVDDEEEVDYPKLNWREIVPAETFLHSYLSECTKDDSPEEYHFWHGLIALGHAVGRKVYLDDMKPVYGNLLVCLFGGTGFGKSRARGWVDTVIIEACPFQDTGLDTTGVKLISVPGSGENLIKQFEHIAHDPSAPKVSFAIRTPVNGIVDFDEFAGLLGRAMRPGNTLKPIIQQMSDSHPRVGTASNTGGEFIAVEPFCSITASTQPAAVRTLISKYDAGSGFLNRWLFVGGPRKKRESLGGRRSRIKVNLDEPIKQLKGVRGWGAGTREVYLNDEAFAEWDKWFHEEIEPLIVNDKTDLLKRLDLTMKRMMLLFAINERKEEVTLEDVERLKKLLPYLIDCYRILNNQIGRSELSDLEDDILRHVIRLQAGTGRGVTVREIGQRMKRKSYGSDIIKKALDNLTYLGMLETEKTVGPGRPTIRYKVAS